MAKMTLLEMTQNILSSMDSDEVNSIFDTIESQQVAEVIKETFYEQFTNIEVAEFRDIIRMTSVSDPTNRPNYLQYATDTTKIEWLKYRGADGKYKTLTFYSPEEFFEKILMNTSTMDNIHTVTDTTGVVYYIKNNKDPEFYTSVNDNLIMTDSYNVAEDTSLQSSKTFAWGTKEQSWTMTDLFIPPIDSNLFPLLLAEAKSVCFINLKQISSAKEEQRARRQRIRMQNDQYKDRAAQHKNIEGPNFARNR